MLFKFNTAEEKLLVISKNIKHPVMNRVILNVARSECDGT